jgi:hypothetical protein
MDFLSPVDTALDTRHQPKFRAWKVSELVASILGHGDRHIVIPTFQRSFVWSKDQRAALIDSIRSGFPIGCILLYHFGFEGTVEKLQLVDGLQRSVTLLKYSTAIFSHSDDLKLDRPSLRLMLDAYRTDPQGAEVPEHRVIASFRNWLRTRTSFDATSGYSNVDLWLHLEKDFGPGAPQAPEPFFMASLQQLLDDLKRRLDISSVEIPVIEFSGQSDSLPEIFDRLNTGGTRLAKYDILAASWNGKYVAIAREDLIEAIKQKYRELLSLGLELEVAEDQRFEDFDTTSRYLLFEFVFALGRCLKNTFPQLYGKSREVSTEVESLGFTLVTLCSGLKIAKLGEFADVMSRVGDTTAYYEALQEATTFLEDALAPCIAFPMDREPRRRLPHTEFQVTSLVASVFRLMFSELLWRKDAWTPARPSIAANIRQWYTYDILRRYWRSAGDHKSFDVVDRLQIVEPVPLDAMTAALDAWFQESLQSRKKDLQAASRCVLKIVAYSKLKKMPSENGRKFNIRQLLSPEEMRGSGITPVNAANILLENPDSERIFDPCGLSGRRPARDQGILAFLETRYRHMRQRVLDSLYERVAEPKEE